MNREPVGSSNLRSVGYDAHSQILEIEFNNGTVYQYYNVPQSVYVALMSAPSHGSYHYRHIRLRYNYRRIA